MLKKYLKITLKILLTLLFIPYVIITALLYTLTIILPGEIIYKMSVLFAYTGWYLCLLNLRLSGKIEIMSDKLTDSYILISNHIGSLDFILIHELAIRNNMLWFMKYIIKKEALKIPVFGYIMDKIKFVFVSRNFDQDQFILKEHCEEIKKSDRKVWFVVYPEGTRFTQKKKNQSVGYANSINVAPFKNVLFPRGKGLKVIIDNLKESQIKEIIDVTLFYEGNIPSLFYFLFFETNANIKIDVRKVNMKEIDDVNEFLLDSFRRKDCLIDNWNDIYSEKENKKII